MVAGAAWACIAGVLKVTRDVNEVIATIMLNSIALSVIQWLFDELLPRQLAATGSTSRPSCCRRPRGCPSWSTASSAACSSSAIVVLVVYWLLVFKSRFGFRLRASGLNPVAARTAGIAPSG